MANGYYSTTLYTNGVETAAYILNADHTRDNWSYNVAGQSYTTQHQQVDAAGREWSAAEIRARTELVLAGRFARVASVEEALAGSAERVAA